MHDFSGPLPEKFQENEGQKEREGERKKNERKTNKTRGEEIAKAVEKK